MTTTYRRSRERQNLPVLPLRFLADNGSDADDAVLAFFANNNRHQSFPGHGSGGNDSFVLYSARYAWEQTNNDGGHFQVSIGVS